LVALFPGVAGAEGPVGGAGDPTGAVEQASGDATGATDQAANDPTHSATQAANDATHSATQAANDATQSATQAANDPTQSADRAAGNTGRTAEQAVGGASDAVARATGDAGGTVDRARDGGSGVVDRAAGVAGKTVQGTGDAVLGRNRRPVHVVELAGKSPTPTVRARSSGQGGFQGARLTVDPENIRLLPPGHLIESIAVGNQAGGDTSSDEETARRVGVRDWLPEWLPSLLAFTGFTAVVLIGVGLGLIKCGAAALGMSRLRLRASLEEIASPIVS
jgi:hypothetical protein